MASTLAAALYGLLLALALPLVWRTPIAALYLWIGGLAAHNAVMAALYGAGVRDGTLTAIQAWKEIVLAVALARVGLDAVRARRLPFRVHPVDWLALAYAALVCVYALLPQSWLGGSADASAVGLALKHDLIPVGAYFLGRSLVVRREQLVTLVWTLISAAAAVAAVGLLDDFLIPIGWWRDSAVVDYYHRHLGYDYQGTGGLPENFIYNTGSELHFLRRLVSLFLSPLASAYMLVLTLLLVAVLRPRLRLLVPLVALTAAALLFTFSRSSLIALAAGLVVSAFLLRRWWPILAALDPQSPDKPPRRRTNRRPPSAGVRAGECWPDRLAHRDSDQGGRVELHGDRRRDRSGRLRALDGVGVDAARRAGGARAARGPVGLGRGGSRVRRRIGPRRPD